MKSKTIIWVVVVGVAAYIMWMLFKKPAAAPIAVTNTSKLGNATVYVKDTTTTSSGDVSGMAAISPGSAQARSVG